MYVELAETLTALVEAISPPPGTLVVTEAELDVPLEIATATVDGRLVFLGGALTRAGTPGSSRTCT